MKKLLATVILLLSIQFAQAQITIKDAKDKSALPAVSVTLSQDTAFKRTLLSDAQGIVTLADIPEGKYRLQTAYVGYKVVDTVLNLPLTSLTLFLKEDATQLKGVTVEAKKKFIERKKGNFVMNIQESALAKTSNLWDALKYAPTVDSRMDGTLKVQNKSATVIIDGRQIYLTGEELMKYLQNIPAANAENVVISSHPGAKYDSSVGAVIIIKTSNLKYEGIRGTLNLGNTYGVFPRYNGGLTLDAKKGKVTAQAGYNYTQNKLENHTDIVTTGTARDLPWTVNQVGIAESKNQRLFGNLGIDFNKNNQLNVYAEYTPNNNNSNITGNNGAFTAQRAVLRDSVWNSFNTINGFSRTLSTQAFFESKWDSTKQSIKITGAFSKNDANATINNDLQYYNPLGERVQKTPYYQALTPSNTNFITFTGQYVRPLWGGDWISGGRYYNTVLSNQNAGYTFSDISRRADKQLTDAVDFRYNELNYGAFTSWEAQLASWYLQLGVRVERNQVFSQTDGGSKSKVYDRTTPFPNIYIEKKLNPKNAFSIIYQKQIERPDYNLLNPFTRFTDNTATLFRGNNKIRPARNHTFKVDWIYDNNLDVSFMILLFNDLIGSVIIKENNQFYDQYDNFKGQLYVSNISYNLNPIKIWQINLNAQLSTIHMQSYGDYIMEKANINFYGSINNSLSLPQNWKFSLSFNGTNRQSYQLNMLRGWSSLDAAIVKDFKKPQLSIYLKATDILKKQHQGTQYAFPVNFLTYQYNDMRTVSFGLTYRFGKQTLKVKEVKKDSELDRANDRL